MSDRRLTPDLLLGAYASGIFPMAETRDDPDVYWVDPQHRGILPLDAFHISRSLSRALRRGDVTGTLDVAFNQIIDGCAAREETWINDTIRDLMDELFDANYAHAFGIWRGSTLIGGMYGLTIGSAFFGESMFSAAADGSKMTLAFAVDHLKRCGFTLFDTQFLTPHLASLGAIEIPRADYHERLADAISQPANIHAIDLETDPQAVVQRITQTS